MVYSNFNQRENDMGLYKFELDCGRSGCLEGAFESTPEAVGRIIGESVYFGEVLGKHSEIHGTIEEGEIKLLTDDQAFIDKAKELGLVPYGYNPFDYWDGPSASE